ncbi:MAG: hypothetical protein VYE19_04070, partial [Chloroflexota bacterium]|nr:hypothetical protein [Chloroflexota bacterium]
HATTHAFPRVCPSRNGQDPAYDYAASLPNADTLSNDTRSHVNTCSYHFTYTDTFPNSHARSITNSNAHS